jgi:hypothetical protein
MTRRHRAFVVAVLLSVTSKAIGYAQGSAEELIALRSHLELPEAVTIRLAPSSQIEKQGSLNVHLAFGLDTGVRNNFMKWINTWNRRDGRRRGMLEIVPELAQADVILARYTVLDKATTQSSGTVIGTPRGSLIGNSGSYQEVPTYAYVLVPSSGPSINILWRYTGTTSVRETARSGQQLWEDFESLLKARREPRR